VFAGKDPSQKRKCNRTLLHDRPLRRSLHPRLESGGNLVIGGNVEDGVSWGMEDETDDAIPEVLFKYSDAGILPGIDSGEIMFSKPLDLNDPYEFLPDLSFLFGDGKYQRGRRVCLGSLGYKSTKEIPGCILTDRAQEWIRKVSGDWFVTSLSTAENNVRMWAQYGGNHSGIKLTLRLPLEMKQHVCRVNYEQPSRADIWKLLDKNLTEPEKGQILKTLATTKGIDWEHEKEYRWFFLKDMEIAMSSVKLVDGKTRAFIPLADEYIQRVTLGYRSSESLLTSLLEIRKNRNAHWEVAKVKLSLNTFQFEDELFAFTVNRRRLAKPK
jgi:hypothetical protein